MEITDTSFTDDVLSELKDSEIVTATPAIIETTTNTKRQLEDDGDVDENERSAKKVCSEAEGEEVRKMKNIDDGMMQSKFQANKSEVSMNETKVDDPEELNLLEQNISEDFPEDVLEKTSETIEDEDVLEELPSQEIEDEEEEIGERRKFQ